MFVAVCPECDEHFELDEDVDVDDLVTCPKCNTRFEVLDLDPIVLEQVVAR